MSLIGLKGFCHLNDMFYAVMSNRFRNRDKIKILNEVKYESDIQHEKFS